MNIQKRYHKEYPIIVGLSGKAASGKTSVAEALSPKASISTTNEQIIWDHLFFTLPLYEIASIKKNVYGFRKKDRQLFSIHEVLFDLFGGNALGDIPDYHHFIDLVQQLHSMEIEPEGVKPRTFLQKAGDLCRSYDSEVFAKWIIYKASKIHRKIFNSFEYNESGTDAPIAILISDVRFKNEAEKILAQPNGIVIYYDASDDKRDERMLKRDGRLMTLEQSSHKSEMECDLVKSISSAIIDTDNMTVHQQTAETLKIVKNYIQENA